MEIFIKIFLFSYEGRFKWKSNHLGIPHSFVQEQPVQNRRQKNKLQRNKSLIRGFLKGTSQLVYEQKVKMTSDDYEWHTRHGSGRSNISSGVWKRSPEDENSEYLISAVVIIIFLIHLSVLFSTLLFKWLNGPASEWESKIYLKYLGNNLLILSNYQINTRDNITNNNKNQSLVF